MHGHHGPSVKRFTVKLSSSAAVSVASKFWHTCKCGQLMANRAGPLAQCFFICFSWAERTANRHAGWPRCRELARAAPEHQLAQLAAPAQQCPLRLVKLRTGACAHRQRVLGFQRDTDVSADTDTDKGSDRLSLPTDIRNRGCHGKLWKR